MLKINKKLISDGRSFTQRFNSFLYNRIARFFSGFTKNSSFIEREEYYKSFIEGMNQGVFTHIDGVVASCNSNTEAMFGYGRGEMIGRPVYDFVAEHHHERVRANMQNRSKKVIHLTGKKADGTTFDIELRGGNVNERERVVSVVDITEQKKVIESLELYRMLFDNATDFIWTMDLDLVFTSASKSAEQILGISHEAIVGKSLKDALPPKWFEVMSEKYKAELTRDGEPGLDPNRIVHQQLKQYGRNGLIDVDVRARILRDVDGNPYAILGITRDISDTIRLLNDLKKAQSRKQMFWDNVNSGFYEIDRHGNFLDDGFNQTILKMAGYTAAEINRKRIMLSRLTTDVPEILDKLDNFFVVSKNPEILFLKDTITNTILLGKKIIIDKEQLKKFTKIINQAHGMNFREFVGQETEMKLKKAFTELWKSGNPESLPSFFDWQIITKDGKKRYVEANVALIFDAETGEKIGFRGTVNDVTESKMRDRKIKNIVDNMQDLIVEFDKNLRIIDITNAYLLAKITGYSEEEIKHMPYEKFMVSDSLIKIKELYKKLKQDNFPAVAASLQLCITRKSGEKTWQDIKLNPIYEDDEHHSGYFAVSRDITDLKRLASIDGLTGVYNRITFETLLEQQLLIAKRDNIKMLFVFFDIDKFKVINDTFGHREGDLALIRVANVLKENLREGDIVGRFGGDEFIALCRAGISHKMIIEEKIKKALEKVNQNNENYKLTLSIGFAEYDPQEPISLQDLLFKADEKMYEDKETNKSDKEEILRY